MTTITAFDNTIYKFNIIDDGLSIPSAWAKFALEELKRPEILSNQSCNLDKGSIDGGMLWSTFETPANSFFSFPETDTLLIWIKSKIKQLAPNFGFTGESIDVTIDWMNVMYKGSFGNCHTHDDESEPDTTRKLVAIFYLQSPENSSDLLVVKKTKDYSSMGVSPFTIPEDEIYPIKVKTGDLIIHKVDLPHAMSKHMNDIPRLVVVMEFRYNEK
jgi:hypothetical protein